jgi:anaerobic glycerol-3-phosphate dehydrogenase
MTRERLEEIRRILHNWDMEPGGMVCLATVELLEEFDTAREEIVIANGTIDRLTAQIDQLRETIVKCALPYEAIRMDSESRRWIAPQVWKAIEEAVLAIRQSITETAP